MYRLSGVEILLVDDNVLNQKIVKFMIQKEGAETHTAINGKEAIAQMREHNFNVVLMDLHMPVLDGFEASQYIRNEIKSNIPIIGITADPLLSEYDKCIAWGMNTCIAKPFETTMLVDLILDLVNKSN